MLLLLLLAITVVILAVYVAAIFGAYRLCVAVLQRLSRVSAVARVVSVDRAKGVERFKLSLGKVFQWNVSVHPEKGTVAGSIQIGSASGWLLGGAVIALAAALVVTKISAVVLPVALVAVAVGLGRRALRRNPEPSPVATRRSL
jgi:hypothetical protein